MTTETAYGLELSEPRMVMTRNGERFVRNADPTEAFWTAWRAQKDALKAQGWSVSKNDSGKWQVAHWRATMDTAQRQQAHEASRAANADIDLPVPEGCELLPFQKAGVAYALSREGTLIGDEMGLGKTVQAIAFANKVAARTILVVAPASLLLNWRNEINKWQTLDLPVHVIRPGSLWQPRAEGWFIINYDILIKYETQLRALEWDVFVMDECHYVKNNQAKRTKLLVGGGRGENKVEPLRAKRKLLLTGTPIMNRPNELWTLVHYLDPTRWNSWGQFARRYCGAYSNGYGLETSGASNLDELQARLRETVMVRRVKADVLKELPAKRRQVVTLDVADETVRQLVDEENRIHDEIERRREEANYEAQQAEAAGDEAAYKNAVAKLKQVDGFAFTEMSRIRHEVALAKVPQVIEHLENTTGKVLVFAHHRDVVAKLVEALASEGVVSITGDTENEDRQPIVARFQTDPAIRFFVGNMKAAGVGLTLTASSHVVFAELDWTPSNISQAEDRAHRIGQSESVTVQHLVLDGSLDSKMAKMVVAKQAVIDQALDRKVAVNYVDQAETAGLAMEPTEVAPVTPSEPRTAVSANGSGPMTPDQIAATHEALRILAGMDVDGARVLNGVGFNKLDTRFGRELAERHSLTFRQAAAGRKVARKYRRQYAPELYARMFPEV